MSQPLLDTSFSISTATTTAVIAAASGKTHYIHGLWIKSNGDQTFYITDGTSNLYGASGSAISLDSTTGHGIVLPINDHAFWRKAQAENRPINIVTSAAVVTTGGIVYRSA